MNVKQALSNCVIATIHISLGISLSALALPAVGAESLADYVATCKEQLGFEDIPQFTCEGEKFRTATNVPYLGLDFSQSDDFVAHQQINDSVDAVFACRWLGLNGRNDRAVGGEMIVHNRNSGGTCFFELQDTFEERAYPQVPINPVPPTHSSAANIWRAPSSVITCTQCHTAGAYIASPEIVGALARFGLINDGHDVWGDFYHAVGSSNSQFAKRLNKEIQNITQPGCAAECHVMRGEPAAASIIGAGLIFNGVVIPSINHIIAEVVDKEAMQPNDAYSDYRWINRDTPSSAGDYERLADVKNEYRPFYCRKPEFVQARVVDETTVYESNLFVDAIETFNLQEGLICLNADQESGKCANYQVRYKCQGRWRSWQSHDTADITGDIERRSKYVFPAACTSPPTAIQARYFIDGEEHKVDGPPDRLYRFNQNGLICRNADQPSGEPCHNYTVRFICE